MKNVNSLVTIFFMFLSAGCTFAQPTPNSSPSNGSSPINELEINSYEECIKAGMPVLRSYPVRCMTPQGKVFLGPKRERQPLPERVCKDMCGDGHCQEIVCQALGCPCAESRASCPQDCKE